MIVVSRIKEAIHVQMIIISAAIVCLKWTYHFPKLEAIKQLALPVGVEQLNCTYLITYAHDSI